MSGQNKILFFLFIVLLIIIIGEIGFYFFGVNFFRSQNKTSNNSKYCVHNPKVKNPAIHPLSLDTFSKMEHSKNGKLYIYTELIALVQDVKYNGVIFRDKKYPFALKLILDETKKETMWMYFPQHVLDKMVVTRVEGKRIAPATIYDLKKEKKVILKETYNPYYSPDDPKQLISYSIEIISNENNN